MRYTKLTIALDSSERPPFFMGSQLRGALGYALKKVVCINPSYQCTGCHSDSKCGYYGLYEDDNIFRSYRFDFRLAQEKYHFDFYLFEKACEELPYIIASFKRLFEVIGLGVERKKYPNYQLWINDTLYHETLPSDTTQHFCVDDALYSPHIVLKLVTPLRIKKNNEYAKKLPPLESIILSILHRQASLLGNPQRVQYTHNLSYQQIDYAMRYATIERYSNRQKTKLNVDGLLGFVEYRDVDKTTFDILKLGELIGVGKQVVFGNGKIEILSIKGA